MEPRLLSVEADHESSLQGFERQTSLTSSYKSSVYLRVKDGVELLLLLTEVGHLVGPNAFVRLFLQIKTRMVETISGALMKDSLLVFF